MEKVFITTKEELIEWLDAFKAEVFSFDLETTGLGIGSKITGASMCDGKWACYIDFLKVGEDYIQVLIKRVCENCKGLILHNAAFDLRFLVQYGMEL